MAGKIAIVLGSKSNSLLAEKAENILNDLGVSFETFIISAHRTPNKAQEIRDRRRICSVFQ